MQTYQTEIVSFNFHLLMAGSEVIVDGTAAKMRTYLSPDRIGSSLNAYLRSSKSRGTVGRASTVPEGPQPIVENSWGTIIVNGVEVTELKKDLSLVQAPSGSS